VSRRRTRQGRLPETQGVMHVTSRFPPALGGMERVVSELTEALADEIAAPVEVLTSAEGAPVGAQREGRVLVRRLRSFNVMVTPVIPGLSWELLRHARPQLLHVHVAHATTPEVVALAARLKGVPFVAHVHIDAAPTTWMGCLLGTYQKFVLAKVLARAALVLVPTDSYRTLLIEKYDLDPHRVRVLPNGTHMPTREVDETSPWTPERPVRLLSVGRVAREKNLPLLIDTVQTLVQQGGLDVDLEIVGDGPAWEEVSRHVEACGLESRVHLTGRKTGSDLIEAYDRADMFVMTSRSESFGMVLIEAMARGIPVIAPDITGVVDIVVNNMTGLLIDDRVASLADAIRRILTEPGLRDRLVNGARKEFRRYEWPAIARQCAQYYGELLPAAEGLAIRQPSDVGAG
jgi:glycosyltransferase involved in cell wall biosynthesis